MSILLSLLAVQALAGQAVAAEPLAGARVAFDRDGVAPAQAAGYADIAAARRLTADDPVRVASISKLAVAIVVLRLVEAGMLDLDADVSDRLGWRLRNPAYPQVPITLRLLLSHRSSLTDAVDYVLPLDAELRKVVADPKAWDTANAPATYFRYTNMNYPVVAAIIERATGQRFDRVMQAQLFGPLGIQACFNWESCSAATAARAVVLYEPDGTALRDDNRGAKPACSVTPATDGACDLSRWVAGRNGAIFSPQGGMRISAKGLARIGRLLAGEGVVDGVRLLSPESFAALATPLWTYDGSNGETEGGFYCSYGLGVTFTATRVAGCADDPFGDGRVRIGHAGDAYRLRSGLWVDRAGGSGVAYYATGVASDAPRGSSAFTAIEERLARGR
ncbi:beta-lactamase family protein [Sphingomonas sp. S1-29]|uniref:serine hydrolase domain-containing protein n=1 Tax=Sphingomonas sp. S1-29 TaxID=2991074 RepID=UPI00223F818F|nr:serine hydrolase [Sphingomonas sp. S1-29]UZK68272.1 beta-lactamase family protein [Sphingomonas sp. S1-29]